jgi:hypothetical protein
VRDELSDDLLEAKRNTSSATRGGPIASDGYSNEYWYCIKQFRPCLGTKFLKTTVFEILYYTLVMTIP